MSKYLSQLRDFGYTDILGWSYSRFDTFQQCKRKYYFDYYAKYDLTNVVKIATLKELTSIPLEIGNVTHNLIRRLLVRLQKSAEPIDLEKFFDYAERNTLEYLQTKKFEDIYYKKRDAIDFKTEIFGEVSKAMENFLKSDRLQWLFEEALISKDDWIVELDGRFKFGECRIDNMKAYCKVDFMFPIDEGVHIIDWKTGKEDYNKHSAQLRGYAGWANFHFDLDYTQIRTTIAYLRPTYKEMSVVLNEYDFDEFIDNIHKQTDAMKEFCAEPELNIPKSKEYFPMTKFENFCKSCKYRELCDRLS